MIFFKFLHFVLVVALNIWAEAHADATLQPPQIEIESGTVEGTWKISADGRQYAAFEGIPYAKPPTGDLRFKEPVPNLPWTGIWKADKIYDCPQPSFSQQPSIKGDEDCLYLNVFIPKTQKTEDFDVLVHIHGGGFATGNSVAYIDPKYAIDRDWILVTMNYRLGALGFLNTEDDTISANNGLKDQALALKWIQENIASFGGNPNSVTLTGFSAGSASVHYHYFNPSSKGLFVRGMSISGTALNPWAMVEQPLENAKILAKALGCDKPNNEEMINCFRQRPASLIVKKTGQYLHRFGPTPICPFAPSIEKGSASKFLADHPYKLLKEKKILDIPWITSVTSEDGLVVSLAIFPVLKQMDEMWPEVAKYVLEYDSSVLPEQEAEIADKIKKRYYKDGKIFAPEGIDIVTRMLTDRDMMVPGENTAELQAKMTKSPVYFAKFEYSGANGWKALFNAESLEGVAHGDDMVYYFGGLITKPLTESDTAMRRILLDVLYAYVHTGTPATAEVSWNPIGEKFTYLNISDINAIKMETKTDYSVNHFWRDLGLLENEKLFKMKTEL